MVALCLGLYTRWAHSEDLAILIIPLYIIIVKTSSVHVTFDNYNLNFSRFEKLKPKIWTICMNLDEYLRCLKLKQTITYYSVKLGANRASRFAERSEKLH